MGMGMGMSKRLIVAMASLVGVLAVVGDATADCVIGDAFDCVLPERDGIVVWDSSGWDCDDWNHVTPVGGASRIDSCMFQGRRFCWGSIDENFDRIVLNPRVINPLRSKILGVCDDYRDNRGSNCASTIGNVWTGFIADGGGATCPDAHVDFNASFDTEAPAEDLDLLKRHPAPIPEDWIGVCERLRCYIYREFQTDRTWNIRVTRQGVSIRNLWWTNQYSRPEIDCGFFPDDQIVITEPDSEIHLAIPGLNQACDWIETVEPLGE